ncbi:ATP-binding protein [Azotobacter chroococcum]|uniref:ATP-binding protein n=1 Tax=Azotobacter chroococcum TaxID=353 RepID=UPI001E2A9B96|nr:ATP-binding protein [Azotobacter chroococcum]
MSRKKLPIGIQTFAKIREDDDYYYVDKTGFALQLIEQGTHYFLSRPRRFGKSLFLDTLAELFAGNEPLFRGLQVHDRWDWSRRHPVLRISFGGGVIRDAQDLEGKIAELLTINEQALGIACTQRENRARFGELIRQAHAAGGERVVVLVDEYDKPILDNLTRPEIARENRDGLRNLYSVIKDSDAHVRFAMLSGVSKFSKVSLFSGLNNLDDISVDSRYSALCGYTETDVDTVFAPELPGLDRDEIRAWYNGYNWTGEAVYNPFDLLLLFQKREFRPYWFETGTPTFLVDLLTERRAFTPALEQVMATDALLSAFEVGDISTEALMFQAGYLTIGQVQRIGAQPRYRLRYPNLEVKASLNEALLLRYLPEPASVMRQTGQLYDLLLANDFPGLQTLFTAFFASIPHDWYRNNPIARYEGYYASVFYSHFAALGLDVRLEDATSHGRIDMTVLFNGHVYLFEFKVVELTPAGQALQQLKDKGYADKYRARGEPIHLLGVEFSRDSRSVVGFVVESLG